MGLFSKNKVKVTVVAKGRVSPSHLNILKIKKESLHGRRFEKSRWDAINVWESRLRQCIFDDLGSKSVNLGGGVAQSIYTDCTFVRCDFVFGVIGNARFENCRFTDCRLSHIFGTTLEMIDCSFSGTRIEKAVFHGTYLPPNRKRGVRDKNEFLRNDFSQAEFYDVAFRGGIDLSKQILPNERDNGNRDRE